MSSLRITLGLLLLGGSLFAQNIQTLYPFDFTSSFQDVFVASDGHGFAIGSCGTLAETTDNGQNWTFDDAPVDYATLIACTPGTNCQEVWLAKDGELHHSTNGGESWMIITVPELNDPWELTFLSDELLVLSHTSDGLLRSTDGGQNWTLVGETLNYRSIPKFVDNQTGFLVDQNGFNFMRSTDAGASWDSLYHFEERPLYLDMLDDQKGFLLLQDRRLWKTIDGGNTWQIVSENTINANPRHLFAFDESTLVATSFPSSIVKSTDGGMTWSSPSTGIDAGHFGLRINGIHRRGENFWIASDATSVIYSGDGFETLTNTIPADRESIESVQFADENTGYALCERRGFFKTTDGGSSWTRVETDFGTVSRDFLVRSADDIIIPYNSSGPQRSLDGGQTWTPLFPMEIQDTLYVFQIEELSNGRLYLMGGQHAAYSDDNGQNWTPVYHNLGGFADMLYFYDDQLGFAGGQGGRLSRTDNGGLTWTSILNGDLTNQPIRNIYMRDALHGFINISSSTYCTDDGGLTWSAQNCNGYNPPGWVTVGPDETLYSQRRAGNSTEISRSIDQGLTWEVIQTYCERNSQLLSVTPDNRYLYLGWTGSLIARLDLNNIVATEDLFGEAESVKIFPNPSTGATQLELPEALHTGERISVRLFAIDGTLVQQFQPTARSVVTLDVSAIPTGIYLVDVLGENYRAQARLVKQ